MTVTESGYYINENNNLNLNLQIVNDNIQKKENSIIYSFLLAALKKRMLLLDKEVTLLCCDNIRENGVMLEKCLKQYVKNSKEFKLLEWIERKVSSGIEETLQKEGRRIVGWGLDRGGSARRWLRGKPGGTVHGRPLSLSTPTLSVPGAKHLPKVKILTLGGARTSSPPPSIARLVGRRTPPELAFAIAASRARRSIPVVAVRSVVCVVAGPVLGRAFAKSYF